MGARAGLALKGVQWFIRGVQFCCAGLVLAIFSYFLATLHNHGLYIATWIRAVEGIAGAATLYTLCGLVFLCCVAGYPLTSFVAMVLDVAFVGAFIYVAQANRGGAGSCRGQVDTPFGSGDSETIVHDDGHGGFTSLPSLHQACQLQTACLAVSIVAIFFFIFSALMEVQLARHRHKEKRFGPGPANGSTGGSADGAGRGGLLGWFRRRSTRRRPDDNLPEHTTPDQLPDPRHSYATETTAVGHEPLGAAAAGPAYGNKYGEPGNFGTTGHHPHPAPYPVDGHEPFPSHGGLQTTTTPASYRYDDGVYNRT